MFRTTMIAALIALPAMAGAQEKIRVAPPAGETTTETGQPPQRIRSVTLAAGQQCPKASGDEIVVCSTLDQPYRIPKQFRELAPSAANQSWVNRAANLDQVGRVAGGLPDTCSAVGTGGQSGCALQLNRAYAADRRAQANEARSIP